jgi:hypothetical protein
MERHEPSTAESENSSGGLVRIFWVNPENGECGNGDPLERSIAEAHAAKANRDWPQIQHWVGDA